MARLELHRVGTVLCCRVNHVKHLLHVASPVVADVHNDVRLSVVSDNAVVDYDFSVTHPSVLLTNRWLYAVPLR